MKTRATCSNFAPVHKGNFQQPDEFKPTADDRDSVRTHKPELFALKPGHDPAPTTGQKHPEPPCENSWTPSQAADPDRDAAVTILRRLKGYTLPAGRMPAAREIVDRLRQVIAVPDLDTAEALSVLQAMEAELTALGGAYDPDLADAIGLVGAAFPGAQLIEVRKLQ
jgi:hypothetical protein